jgi:Lrp/AsnC family transcriptional regulator, leucine-responsive regulatory protein
MKLSRTPLELDETDRRILAVLQEDCKTPLAKIGEAVDLSAPAVTERIRKLEEAGIVRGYHAVLDGRKLGLDITAFIGVSIDFPKMIESFEREVNSMPDILECHHVTGGYSLLLKVKTWNTASLEGLISRLRSIRGVLRTETMIVLSTRNERTHLPLGEEPEDEADARAPEPALRRRGRDNGKR